MDIRSESRIHHPVSKVFEAYRDHMADVAEFLPDIKCITVLKRSEDGDKVSLHNEWVSDREVPAVAASLIKPDQMRWDDFATWDSKTHTCHWEIKTRFFTDSFTCKGQTELVEQGDATVVRLSGSLAVDLSNGIKGVPGFVARRLAPQIEKLIVGLVTPNLEKTNDAISQYLDAQG